MAKKKILFRVEVSPPLRDEQRRFAKATAELKAQHRDSMRTLGRNFVKYAREEAPKKTGKFAKGIRFRTYERGDDLSMQIYAPSPLVWYIIKGTKAHPIPKDPSRSKTLHFYWEKIGEWVYFRQVQHPGTKPNPFMERAEDRLDPDIETEVRKLTRTWQITRGF
jgi:hypothetical protein